MNVFEIGQPEVASSVGCERSPDEVLHTGIREERSILPRTIFIVYSMWRDGSYFSRKGEGEKIIEAVSDH